MRFIDFRYEVWTDWWFLLPTIIINLNQKVYSEKNLAVEIHFLCIHMRWFWSKE